MGQLIMLTIACCFTTHLQMGSNKHYVCMPAPQFSPHHYDSLQRHRTLFYKFGVTIKQMFSFNHPLLHS